VGAKKAEAKAIEALLADLNESQREAVCHGDGPLLVFAGAGSGKTRALTYRIAYLIEACGVAPESILAVTFTNKAAGEMKERIRTLIGDRAAALWAGTFHSMCARMLRRHGRAIKVEPNFVIFDTPDQMALIKEALSVVDVDQKEFKPPDVHQRISAAKNELIGPTEFRRTRKGPFDEIVGRAYRIYQEKLAQNNALDFDDLIMRAVQLLREAPEVREHYQDRFGYVLVDEYQDINFAQYTLVKLLGEKHRNVCVVGDDDQSIYGWRGADVGIILDFEKDYPDAHVVKLEQNYRSTQRILECANEVIAPNRGRAPKRLWTDAEPGESVTVYEAVNEQEEAHYVASCISRAVQERGRAYRDFAILYRTNAQSRVLEEAFLTQGLPYRIVGGVRFYERREIKDLIAYLRVLLNPADSVSLRRIINVPTRGIGDKTVAVLDRLAYENAGSLLEACRAAQGSAELSARAQAAVERFERMIARLSEQAQRLTVTKLTNNVLEQSGYLEMLEKDGTAESAARAENLKEFLSLTQKFEQSHEEASLSAFLEHVALLSDIDESDDSENAVAMMTLHSAKGLEFPVVFMVGLEENIFPHQRSMRDERELAEERRLCYVGLTRAQEQVTLTHCRRRTIYGQTQECEPSRFLKNLPEEHVERYDEVSRLFATEPKMEELAQAPVGGAKLDLVSILRRARENAVLAREREKEERKAASTKMAAARPGRPGTTMSAGERPKRRTGKMRAASQGCQGFRAGEKIIHPKFGKGIVVSCTEAEVTVAFPDQGVKKLSLDYAKLERASSR